jgi:hypothetical protein
MTQLSLDITPPRRIDVTLERLQASLDAMDEDQRAELNALPQFNTVVIVARLRAMERCEKEVRSAICETMADAYDRVAVEGENAANAILRTFRAVYGANAKAA